MLSALKLSALGAAMALLGSAAVAGDAPAAFYPSLGYGQSVSYGDIGPGGYADAPAYAGEPDYGPPPGYDGPPPGYDGPPPRPRPCNCVTSRPLPPPGPPVVYGGEARSGYADRSFEGEQAYGEDRRDEYDYDSGWRFRRIEAPPVECPYARMPVPHPVCGGEQGEEVEHMSDLFFADAGGVGPDEFEGGGGGGGGGVIEGGEAGASAGAFAFASASASARASIGIHIGRHPGGGHHGGGHMPHGCGCKK